MPYDPGLVERVRDALARLGERGSRERGVFSGRGFLQGKRAFVIVWGEGLLAKVPPERYAEVLERPGVTPFAPDGERAMGTWLLVMADVVADDPELAEWVALALQGVRSAPVQPVRTAKRVKSAKPVKAKRPSTRAKRSKSAKPATSAKHAKSTKPATSAKPAQRATTSKSGKTIARGKRR
jgi:hypothetical protein